MTEADILNEYPEDYFKDTEDMEYDKLSSFFTPKEIAEKTIEYLRELEK